MQSKANSQNAACTTRHVEITHADLPLSCPPKVDRIWDAHPRIYMPIEETGATTCPYCGTHYVLKDFKPVGPEILIERNPFQES